jgi:hypothetical protein
METSEFKAPMYGSKERQNQGSEGDLAVAQRDELSKGSIGQCLHILNVVKQSEGGLQINSAASCKVG